MQKFYISILKCQNEKYTKENGYTRPALQKCHAGKQLDIPTTSYRRYNLILLSRLPYIDNDIMKI